MGIQYPQAYRQRYPASVSRCYPARGGRSLEALRGGRCLLLEVSLVILHPQQGGTDTNDAAIGAPIVLHCEISYSATSSARSRIDCGTVRPSAVTSQALRFSREWSWCDRSL
jgi:hypothetical protein